MVYLFLALTIFAELIGAISSRYSNGFKRIIPSSITIVTIIAAYFFFAISLKFGLNIGIGYAIWSGVGVTLIAIWGWVFFKEILTKAQVLGVILIIVGVVLLEIGAMEVF